MPILILLLSILIYCDTRRNGPANTAFRSRFVGSGRPGFDDRGRSAPAAAPRPSSTVLALPPGGAALLLGGAVLLRGGAVLPDGANLLGGAVLLRPSRPAARPSYPVARSSCTAVRSCPTARTCSATRSSCPAARSCPTARTCSAARSSCPGAQPSRPAGALAMCDVAADAVATYNSVRAKKGNEKEQQEGKIW